ncbi:MAG: Eco57I restriction-modification methylase domain-containing protein [Acidobacteriaceae bacterium]
MLDHTAVRATEPVLGIRGTRGKDAEIPLAKLETTFAKGQEALVEFLHDKTGRTEKAIKRALDEGTVNEEHPLLIACGHDAGLLQRVRTFAGLIREDSFERAMIVLPGSIYVTAGTTRRSTGTHYTPPSLTEPIVQHTLEPLVFCGPSEGLPQSKWQLKSPKEILDLKVCDMAMGSGAFLVQACRYLSERLAESWENEEKKHPNEILITPEGGFSEGAPTERLIPADTTERLAIARRIVADRCLYGVDINPMAVEMSKLSMWLITLDAKRPFTFLDHAFKWGDSLLGLSSFKQLEDFSLRPEGVKQVAFSTMNLWRHVEESKKKRQMLEAMPSDTPEQVAAKAVLYAEAEEAVVKLKAAADLLVASELRGLKGKKYEEELESRADRMMMLWSQGTTALKSFADDAIDRRKTLHWPLIFPEVMERGGFDAFVGNPPFMGGRLTGRALGQDYQNILDLIRRNVVGSPDLCAYFLLRAFEMLRRDKCLGMIATKSIAQTGSRTVSLDQLIAHGAVIYRAESMRPWPGLASVVVAIIHIAKGKWVGSNILNSKVVDVISGGLEEAMPETPSTAYKLSAMSGRFSQGQDIMGKGFELSEPERSTLIANEPESVDVVLPLYNGQDLNNMPTLKPYRWVIYFRDWPYEKARSYRLAFDRVEQLVKPYRDSLTGQIHQKHFWKFWDLRPRLMKELSEHGHVLAAAINTKYVCFRKVPTDNVYNKKAKLLFIYRDSEFAVLQSTFHTEWAEWRSGTLGATTLNYSTSVALETWPMPRASEEIQVSLEEIGKSYHSIRESILHSHHLGLTECYNRFHDESIIEPDIVRLRQAHIRMDQLVLSAYGWSGIDLEHGFRETQLGVRFTISEDARRKILSFLLILNHERHTEEKAEEMILGKQPKATGKRGRKAKAQAALDGVTLFSEVGE